MTIRHKRFTSQLAALLVFSLMAIPALAQESQITRIEEDWSVRIIESDSSITAPQFTTIMTPSHLDPDTYFSFELNHSTAPEFRGGGLQMQAWSRGDLKSSTPRLSDSALDSEEEKLSWTQYVKVEKNDLVFGVKNFNSSSWDLNERESIIVMKDYGHDRLNDFRLSNSVEFSTVGFSGNRVGYMMLSRVRVYSGDKLLKTYEVGKNVNRGHATLFGDK